MKSCIKYLVLLFCINCIEGSYRCDYKYSSIAQTWFKFFDIPATWYDARLRCTLEGAILASPTTQEIEAEMKKIINTSSQFEIFTGIHATFSQGDYYSVEGIPLSQIPITWAPNEPDNRNNTESCIALDGNGDVADRSCEETRPYICYRAERFQVEVTECGTIDPEYKLDKRTNKCYKFHPSARNFSRAFLTCSAEGGHLAIINNEEEATVLKELFAKYPAEKMVGNYMKDVAFIGFHDWGESWEWRTIHGQTLTEAGFDKFLSGEPNNFTSQHCGAIYRQGLLGDLWCDRPVPFICEKNPGFPVVCRIIPETA